MTTALYIIWFLFPLFFLLMALWAFLERLSGKRDRQDGSDALKQGLFVLCCVLVAVAIDMYVLPDLVESLAPDWIPLGFFQVILLPVIFYLGALVFGGSKEILIGKAPKPSQAKRRR